MPTSRAVLVLGMHRSGTSAIARGLATLGVYLGNDFLDAQPENPTGYWEDRNVVALDDRVLKELGLSWDATGLIERRQLDSRRVRALQREAAQYCGGAFGARPLWGFKDPRAIRVLPFWEGALAACDSDDSYVVVIRNPRSVAASLFARQKMDAEQAYRLWNAHMLPFLADVFDKPMVVVDYDLLMEQPRVQLERAAAKLALDGADAAAMDRFAAGFLDERLRHSSFSESELDDATPTAHLTRDAYLLLRKLAQDREDAASASFQSAWARVADELARNA